LLTPPGLALQAGFDTCISRSKCDNHLRLDL
jgi:hypothetical protein